MYRNPFQFETAGNHTRVNTDTMQSVTIPGTANLVLIQAEAQPIRYTINSTVPTATTGFRLLPTEGVLRLDAIQGTTIRFISESAGAFVNYQLCRSAN